GGDRVDRRVRERGAQRLDVLRGTQGWIDLVDRVVVLEELAGQQQVMGRYLGGHRDPPRLCPPQYVYRSRGRDMADVQSGAGVLREHDVAGDDRLLGDRRPAGQTESSGERALVRTGGRVG